MDPHAARAEVEELLSHRNALAIVEFSEKTRALVRSLEEQVTRANNNALQALELIDQQRVQIGILRAQLLGGGPTEVDDGAHG